jgi:hypothetical protein
VAKYMEGNGRGCYDLPPLTNDCIVILIFWFLCFLGSLSLCNCASGFHQILSTSSTYAV